MAALKYDIFFALHIQLVSVSLSTLSHSFDFCFTRSIICVVAVLYFIAIRIAFGHIKMVMVEKKSCLRVEKRIIKHSKIAKAYRKTNKKRNIKLNRRT